MLRRQLDQISALPGKCLFQNYLRCHDDIGWGVARLCGLESAQTPEETEWALACDVMLHAWMLPQSGIPVLYSGDEIGQRNDNAYHQNPDRCADSRYLHRGDFDWKTAELRKEPATRQGRLFMALRKLETIRASERVFHADASVSTFDTGSDSVLGVCRELDGEFLLGLFNFSDKAVEIDLADGRYWELFCEKGVCGTRIKLLPYDFMWLKRA